MRLSVVLCARNGARFISEQLESISNQTRLPDEVILSDDASTDDTGRIIREWAQGKPFPVRVILRDTPLGVVGHFSEALGHAGGDWVFMADQDDYWLPEKIALSVDAAFRLEKAFGVSMPALVHTDAVVTDGSLRPLKRSLWQRLGYTPGTGRLLRRLLVQNFVTGCTSMINRPLLDISLPVPGDALMHDWWMALVAAASGVLLSIPERSMYYRRHAGAVTFKAGRLRSGTLGKALRLLSGRESALPTITMARSLLEHFPENRDARSFLETLSRGPLDRAVKLSLGGYRKSGRARNLFWLASTLAWKGGGVGEDPLRYRPLQDEA